MSSLSHPVVNLTFHVAPHYHNPGILLGKFSSSPYLLKLTPTLQQTLSSPSQRLVVKQFFCDILPI